MKLKRFLTNLMHCINRHNVPDSRASLTLETLEDRLLLATLGINDVDVYEGDALPVVTFAAAENTSFDFGTSYNFDPQFSAAGDLDGDGDLDLVFESFSNSPNAVLKNDGNGVFSGGGFNGNFENFTLDDLDADGDIDIASNWSFIERVRIFGNKGDGTFALLGDADLDSPILTALVAADLDGDGDKDLAVTNSLASSSTDTVWLLKNNGSGSFSFSAADTVTVGNGPADISQGDLDGDGDVDLVVTNQDSDNVSVMLNNGSASFTVVNVGVGNGPRSIAIEDLDGDGDLDAVTANSESNTITILSNNGRGKLSNSQTISVGTLPHEVAAGDLDRDGDMDLVVANEGSDNVTVLLNRGSASFTELPGSPLATEDRPANVLIDDFTGDGELDLLVGNRNSHSISLFRNTSVGRSFVEFTATLSHAPADGETVSVDYRLVSRTADAGVDFADVGGTVRFGAGVTSQKIMVPVIGDGIIEGDETFYVRLTHPLGATIADIAGRGRILNEDLSGPLVVTKTQDTNDGFCSVNDCSLREAINKANGMPGNQTIVLPAGTYKIRTAYDSSDDPGTGDFDVFDQTGTVFIRGAGAKNTIIDANQMDRVFFVGEGASAVFQGVTITGGRAAGAGGNVGGGIANFGNLTIRDSIVSHNHAGKETIPGQLPNGHGGGISNWNGSTLLVENSAIIENSAGLAGGGIRNFTTNDPAPTVTILNSTISGNSTEYVGGGIYGGNTKIFASTIYDNSAEEGGGIFVDGQITIGHSIVAGNHSVTKGPDIRGTVKSDDYNMIQNTANATFTGKTAHNILGVDPLLGPLADNGGPTPTHRLLDASPAIDAGNNTIALATDQRDALRTRTARDPADIGAFERWVVRLNATNQADVIKASVTSAKYQIRINGDLNEFNRYLVESVSVNALGGKDKVTITGTNRNESAKLWVRKVEYSGPKYLLKVVNVENVRVVAGSGNDRAYMYDAAGNDTFIGRPAYSILKGNGFHNRVIGFDKVNAYAAAGGADRANLHDSSRDDKFYGRNAYGQLTGSGFLLFAKGFDRIDAYAKSGGFDTINNRSLDYDFFKYGSWEKVV